MLKYKLDFRFFFKWTEKPGLDPYPQPTLSRSYVEANHKFKLCFTLYCVNQ